MDKIYFIIYWYKNEIGGQIHCNNDGEPIFLDNRDAAFAYLEELKRKNPDYTFSLRSMRSDREV